MNDWRRLSRLPESPDYWRGLEERIRAAARPALTRQHRRERWLSAVLATAVTAAAAVVALLLAQPEVTVPPASLEAALAPTDPLALELLSSRAAPHISGLLPAYIPGGAR